MAQVIRSALLSLLCCLGFVAAADAAGKETPPRVLFLLAQGFNAGEFYSSYLPLHALGYQVDVASFEAGRVPLRTDGSEDRRGRDWQANLGLDQVQVANYIGLVVPGGYSPGFLEKDERALKIVQTFAQTDKTMGGVCHGPRLFLQADVMQGKRFTSLFNVATEVPSTWRQSGGTYFDAPVVADGQFVTSRFPGDMTAFTRALEARFAVDQDGLPMQIPAWQSRQGTVVVDDQSGAEGHAWWSMQEVGKVLGFAVAKQGTDGLAEPTVAVTIPAGTSYWDAGPLLVQAAQQLPIQEMTPNKTYILHVMNGFDDTAVAMASDWAMQHGHPLHIVSDTAGTKTGVRGLQVTAKAMTDVTIDPATSVLIAPGGIWASVVADARQGQTDELAQAQATADAARVAWLIEHWQAGAQLVTVGLDSQRIGREAVFKGMKFAGSVQTMWGFGKAGGKFTKDLVYVDDKNRLASARSGLDLLGFLSQ